jgi:fumarylpyruvate hydrolase
MSTEAKSYVIPQPPQAAIPVAGTGQYFPVRRLWCVGRNYVEHIKEMGQDVREPPFFFDKPADAIVPDGGTCRKSSRSCPRWSSSRRATSS